MKYPSGNNIEVGKRSAFDAVDPIKHAIHTRFGCCQPEQTLLS